MDFLFLNYIFTHIVIGALSLTIGIVVFLKDTKAALQRTFLQYNAAIAWWAVFTVLMEYSRNAQIALLMDRFSLFGIILLPASLLHFTCEFLGNARRARVLIASAYVVTSVFSVLSLTPYMAESVSRKSFIPYFTNPGLAYGWFVGFFSIVMTIANTMVAVTWLKTRDEKRRRGIFYFFLAGLLSTGFGAANYSVAYGVVIPFLVPFGNYTIVILGLVTGYIILQHNFFLNIEVAKRAVVFAGLSLGVLGTMALITFITQELVVQYVAIPKLVSSLIVAGLVAGFYNLAREFLVNTTDRYLFQKRYDYKVLLRKFTDEVMVIVDLHQLVQTTVNTLAETVRLESVKLLLLKKDTRKYEQVAAKGGNGQVVQIGEEEPFITFLRETHEVIGLDGQLGGVRFPSAVTDRVRELGARLCIPLNLHEDLIGVLCLGKKKSDKGFTKDDLDILMPLARTLAIAISNAQLFDELAKTQALAAQKEKLAVIGTLSAGINHEICNPLGIVKAQCESFLLDQQDGILMGRSSQELMDRASTIMQVALKQIDRATAITQKLSNFAKPIKEAKAQAVPVEQEIDEVLMLVGHDLKLEKIDVRKEIEPGLPSIVVDRRQLQEVLFNLLRNAGQAIIPPGSITVRAAQRDSQVRIEIADTGTGIPPDKLEKIYDPFFTTKEPGKGTGLGLFIVRQIVERNKGRISLESAVGKGTTFFLDFPAANAAELLLR